MTAHNDKVEAVAEAIELMIDNVPTVDAPQGAIRAMRARSISQAVLTLMEERGWLKADASRSVSSPEAAGQYLRIPDGAFRLEDPTWSVSVRLSGARLVFHDDGRVEASEEWRDNLDDLARQAVDAIIQAYPELLQKAARSDSEDTQQAEGAANQLQELIKAAEKICAKYPLDYDANELQLALQNVKKSDK